MIRVVELFFAFTVCLWAVLSSGNSTQTPLEEPTVPQRAIAVLQPTLGHDAMGTVFFDQEPDGVRITGQISRLAPGKHGFHIHEFGDESAPDATSAGDHFDPGGLRHGKPGVEEHHYGDLGNITANDNGIAKIDMKADWLKIDMILGRALIIHAKPDNFQPPAGGAGPRVAIGIIGVGNPQTSENQ